MANEKIILDLKCNSTRNRYKIKKPRKSDFRRQIIQPADTCQLDTANILITCAIGNNIYRPMLGTTSKQSNCGKGFDSHESAKLSSSESPVTLDLKLTRKPSTLGHIQCSMPKISLQREIGLEKELLSNKLQNRVKDYHSSTKNRRCACGDCEECYRDFAYFLHIFSDDQSIPQISAKSWCIWRKKNGRFAYYYGKRIHKVREIASLSKMITAMTAIDVLTRYSIDPSRIKYEIHKTSIMVGGTTANLEIGQVVSLLDLFYGMMLPSGNDAAVAISEAIGLIQFLKSRNKPFEPYSDNWYQPYLAKNYAYLFIEVMNQKCHRLGAEETQMFNSHGNDSFDQLKNVSTCNQVAKIASQFMTYPLLRDIVKTNTYGKLQNTNKLLEAGFDGIKTGITDTAGPCLAASYKDLIIVVLNSRSMNERWIEVKKLVKWITKKVC